MFFQPDRLLKPQHLGAYRCIQHVCVTPKNAAATIPPLLRQTLDVSDERQRAIVSTENAMSDLKDEEDASCEASRDASRDAS